MPIEYIGEKKMDIGYEEKFDVLGIVLKDDYEYDHSIEVKPLFIADIDTNNEIVALELVDVARGFGVTSQHIKTADIKPYVKCGEFGCRVGVKFKFLNGREEEIYGGVFL